MNGFPAALCTGVAMWCSLGAIGVTDQATNARVALLAPWWWLPLLVGAALAAIRLLGLSPREQAPLFGSAVAILPWLPFSIPPAALLWTGPLLSAIWVVTIAGVAIERLRAVRVRWFTDAARAPIAATVLALALYAATALWLSPILPDGDEPHYLILAQSLIKDGDLRIENNHRQGDYLGYSLNAAAPDYLRRGVNGEIYSIHAPGLAVAIAPAMWLFGYPGVVAFLGVVAALSTALVWRVAYQTTESATAAWFGWACCAATTPFVFQATEVFPDGVAATCLLVGTLPLWNGLKARQRPDDSATAAVAETPSSALWLWAISGASLAVLPWLQTRLAVLAIAGAFCLTFRIRSRREALAFAIVPAIAAALWFGFFIVVYGTPNPTAPYGPYTQTSVANLFRGLPGLLFDQQFGLIPNAPSYGFVLGGVVIAASKMRRWSWEALALTVPYTAAVGTYQMWWGGTSVPGRLLTSVTLILGVVAARVWLEVRTGATKTLGLLALAASVLIAIAMASHDHGRLLLNFRDGISLWLEWANDVVDLPRGLPSLFRDDRAHLWLKIATWAIAAAGLWTALRVVESNRSSDDRRTLITWPSIWCAAIAVMVAFTVSWRVDGSQALTPQTSQIGLLRQASPLRSQAFDFATWRLEPSTAFISSIHIQTDRQRRPAGSPSVFVARDLPAGSYALHVVSEQPIRATLAVHAGSASLPLHVLSATMTANDKPTVIKLPTRLQSLTVEGDPAAVRSASAIELQPLVVSTDADRAAAHRAVRYESASVFFMDEHAYPEPTGFWIAGGRSADVIISREGTSQNLLVRNAPVDNHLTVDVNGEARTFTLSPGQEVTVPLPRAPDGRPLRVRLTSQTGFRPSTTEPGSTDLRYLGCWIEPR